MRLWKHRSRSGIRLTIAVDAEAAADGSASIEVLLH
jgi:hypothetical protein